MEKETIRQQNINLMDRKILSITGVDKMLSVKPDLLQLITNYGTMQIVGANMEVSKLDLEQKILEVRGVISQVRYLDDKKLPLLKRIFK